MKTKTTESFWVKREYTFPQVAGAIAFGMFLTAAMLSFIALHTFGSPGIGVVLTFLVFALLSFIFWGFATREKNN